MKKYIRWQGIAGLISILLIFSALVYVFAGKLIQLAIEKGGSYYLGAEVSLESVQVDWSPFKIELNVLQATDPQQPMQNLLAFKQASIEMNLWQYLLGRYIFEDASITELAFNQARATAGDVYTKDPSKPSLKDKAQDKVKDIKAEIPDVESLLKQSDLITVKKAENMQQVVDNEQQAIKQIKENLPDQARLKEYEKRVKKLTETEVKSIEDVAKLKAELDALKDDIKADKAQLKAAKTQLVNSKAALSQAATELKDAPQQDWQKVKETYQLETFEAEDLAHILFGSQAREYYQQAQRIYQFAKPFLQGESDGEGAAEQVKVGRFVHFDEQNPLPAWLLKQGEISLLTPHGKVQIVLNEINMQHWLRKQSSQINFHSSAFANGQLDGTVTFYKFENGDLSSQGQWTMEDLKYDKGQASGARFALVQSGFNGHGEFEYKAGQITARSDINLQQPKFSTTSSSRWMKQVINALSGQQTIPAQIRLSGDALKPSISVDSQLDEIVKQSVTAQADAELDKLKSKFQSQLKQKVSQKLNLSESEMAEIGNLTEWVDDTEGTLNKLLESKIDSFKDKQKDKLKDKLNEKLGDKLNKLFG
ncbi:TIGR03545 family protein [Catenovulum sediminis]|uniref:TIGR03545 family protein n=1 Tax=Catenovulum sediminis TaxID=1740262 RepID=UPI0011811DF7|nr:TIGR03545 family protein [Catenovulum sediminis]